MAEAHALPEKLIAACVGTSHHQVVLESLLAAYVAVAKTYPCCGQPAAAGAIRALATIAAADPAAGHRVH